MEIVVVVAVAMTASVDDRGVTAKVAVTAVAEVIAVIVMVMVTELYYWKNKASISVNVQVHWQCGVVATRASLLLGQLFELHEVIPL